MGRDICYAPLPGAPALARTPGRADGRRRARGNPASEHTSAPERNAEQRAHPPASSPHPPRQARLAATAAEVESICGLLAASREREAVRFAYRHATPDADAEVLMAAQAWPKAMAETLER